jgi:FkbM family methyltransferase
VVRGQSFGLSKVEPYIYVEAHAERLFTKYLKLQPEAVRNIVIVGAWQGAEIPGLLRLYPLANIVAFEPSPHNFAALHDAFGGETRVRCVPDAVGASIGSAVFHEGSLPGTGSLLAFGDDAASRTHNFGLIEKETFAVEVSTLDESEATRRLEQVDLLKIDVQGGEIAVIRGGTNLIKRTLAVLVEVGLRDSAYAGAATFQEVDAALRESGLTLCGLGVDPVTLDGNALYIRLR